MSSVFISYSRKDIDFAHKLTESLESQDLDFWIDWEGIPPSVDWWMEIEKGIEEADIFLFLISPDSITSKICEQEIDHAVQNGKRLIPIIVRDIKAEESPTKLSHLNWIFFRGNDDYQESLEKLISAIKTDYEWVQFHRRLQVRALEWERGNKESSFLLRGKDLRAAEELLATEVEKDPRPTKLQRQYLLTSRKAETKTRNRLLISGGGLIIGLIAMLIFALVQLRISRAQQMGYAAQVALAEEKYNLAALYAYQSSQIHENEAATFVLGKLPYEKDFIPAKALLEPSEDLVQSVAWSRDGRLASGSLNAICIWDLETRQPAKRILVYKIEPVNLDRIVTSLSWSPDGRLASGFSDGIVLIWDLENETPAVILREHSGSVNNLTWSSDGRLASASQDSTVIIWDLQTGQPSQVFQNTQRDIASLAWSQDGRLASGSLYGDLVIWNLETGQPAQTIKGDSFRSLAWSSDGHLVSASGELIIIWDLESGEPAQELQQEDDFFRSVAWSADGQLASDSRDSSILIWDLESGQPAHRLRPLTDSINVFGNSLDWSADGRLASASNDKFVIVWDVKQGAYTQTMKGIQGGIDSLDWSNDGRLASASDDNTIIIWDIERGQPAQTFERTTNTSPLTARLAWSRDGRLASRVAYSDDTNVIILWDLDTGQPAQILEEFGGIDIAWSPSGQLASVSDDYTIHIWDLDTGQPIQTLNAHERNIVSIAWSDEGRLASAENDSIIIWDLEASQPAQTIQVNDAEVDGISWSPGGLLASIPWSIDTWGTYPIILWNPETGRRMRTLRGHSDFINSLAWSDDGRLASASYDETVIVWDMDSSQPAFILRGHTDSVESVAWSPQGDLASASRDGTIKIVKSGYFEQPCNWIFRNMTLEEWVATQGLLYTYRPACPNLPVDVGSLSLATLSGRFIWLGLFLVILLILWIPLWIIYRIILWARMRLKKNSNLA